MELQLYKIERDYIALAEAIINNDGEVSEAQNEALQINKEQLETKGRGYGFIVKQLESEIDIIDSEIKRLYALKISRTKTVDRLKTTLANAMQLFEIEKIETPTLKISFRKSESVEIVDINFLDKKFIIEKITHQVDKIKIKESLKSGEPVSGAILVENKNLQIK